MKYIVILFLALNILFVNAQVKHEHIKDQIQKLKLDPKLQHASLAFHIYDISSKSSVYQYNEQLALTPASCLKVVTTSAALGVLGEDFKFETKLLYSGELVNGIINGDLIIQGGGDPTLGSSRIDGNLDYQTLIDQWIKSIKDKGIAKIKGKLIIDASYFEKQGTSDGWQWGDIGNYFGATAYGFNFNENYYKLYFQPGLKADESTQIIKHEPVCPGLTFENTVLTGEPNSGDNAFIYGAPFSLNRFIKGTIPPGSELFSIKGSMPDPAVSFAAIFSSKLKKAGLIDSINYQVNYDSKKTVDGKTLVVYNSPALKEIVKHTNLRSINLYAEALLKMLGKKTFNKGTTEDGIKAVMSYWEKQGMKLDGLFMYDGSGLSPANSITAAQMSFILQKVSTLPFSRTFENSLPKAGATGTLSKLCKGTAAENNLIAKSGNINRVTTYAGYVKNKAGSKLCFVFIAQNYEGENSEMIKRFEKIMIKMAE